MYHGFLNASTAHAPAVAFDTEVSNPFNNHLTCEPLDDISNLSLDLFTGLCRSPFCCARHPGKF
ncbi:hypothetical protein AN416_09525 [Paraburkholderia caribensis]|nr:hypothetical protein AN416_09525 [Paraburkholderia caribensis]